MENTPRSSVYEMAMNIALELADRSEDEFTKVGCVAMTSDNRIIATAYNGLLPKHEIADLRSFVFSRHGSVIKSKGKFKDTREEQYREHRLHLMVHSEVNMCSLIKRGEATQCVINICPCPPCMLTLAVHGIKKVIYLYDYNRDSRSKEVADFYNLELIHYIGPCKARVMQKPLKASKKQK